MKKILNNKDNTLLFITNGIDYSLATTVRLRQLGGSGNIDIPITNLLSDCFTCSFDINVPIDSISNGTYLLKLLDNLGNILATSTASVDGYNEDNPRAFIVTDDTVTSEQFIALPQASFKITWSDDGLTFSNN